MTGLRLVLDTNGLLSALLFPTGSLSWLRQAWQSEAVLPPASRCPGDRRQPPARFGISVFGSDPDPQRHQRSLGPKMKS